LLGDLRRFIDVSIKEPIREFIDISPKFDRLVNVLSKCKDLISKIYINCSEEMEFLKNELSKELRENYIYTLPHPLSDNEIREIIARIIA
jgi:hypothetical protein